MLKYSTKLLQSFHIQIKPFIHTNTFKFGMLTDKLTERQSKKAQNQFKQQIQHMSSKPSFTLMDYRQRILDELSKLKNSVRKKMSQDAVEAEKALQEEKKILMALFEEELVCDEEINHWKKQQISMVTGASLDKVKQLFEKAERHKKMHKLLRGLKQSGEPLPDSMNELQMMYMQSGLEYKGKSAVFMRQKQQRGHQSYLKKKRMRYIKFKKM